MLEEKNFMQSDLAIDLGTSNTRIFIQENGIEIDEPSVITVDVEEETIIAVGKDAYQMLGRTSDKKLTAYPITGGVISDFAMVEAMLKTFLRRVTKYSIGMPKAVVCIPRGITEVEKSAVVNVISSSGIRKVCIIEEPVAAAMGAGIDISSPHGSLIVNMGGGTTQIAVISLGGISVSKSVRYGGNSMDEDIIKYIKKTYNMLIGKRTAEQTKINAGSVISGIVPGTYPIKGKCLVTGMPIKADIDAEELVAPLQKTADIIISQIQDILVETPPELLSDIYTDGMMLTGGTANLRGIARFIHEKTGLKVNTVNEPEKCVIKGCGEAIKYIYSKPSKKGGINPIIEKY